MNSGSLFQKSTQRKKKWYRNEVFPLLPILSIKKSDYHNTSGFTFHWLFLKLWSLDAFTFELAFNISTHWGIGITAIVPYLRIVFCIPCPMRLGIKIDRLLNRRPEVSKEYF